MLRCPTGTFFKNLTVTEAERVDLLLCLLEQPKLAMTGEVSLRGTATPIGGLPEKLMAAQRAGVTKVFIPADNEDDLRDVPKEILVQLTIVPVQTVDEILSTYGIEPDEPALKAV